MGDITLRFDHTCKPWPSQEGQISRRLCADASVLQKEKDDGTELRMHNFTKPDPGRRSFLDLPGEIRNRVYYYALTPGPNPFGARDARGIVAVLDEEEESGRFYLNAYFREHLKAMRNLDQICFQVRREARTFAYANIPLEIELEYDEYHFEYFDYDFIVDSLSLHMASLSSIGTTDPGWRASVDFPRFLNPLGTLKRLVIHVKFPDIELCAKNDGSDASTFLEPLRFITGLTDLRLVCYFEPFDIRYRDITFRLPHGDSGDLTPVEIYGRKITGDLEKLLPDTRVVFEYTRLSW